MKSLHALLDELEHILDLVYRLDDVLATVAAKRCRHGRRAPCRHP